MSPALCTKRDIAERYRVAIRTIDRWIAKGIIPVIRISPRCLRFDVARCDQALRRFCVEEVSGQ
jgi:predicted site-specific integrase-resolvase